MENHKQVVDEPKQTEPMSYEEAFSKLRAFILKSREEEKAKENNKTDK